MLIEIESQQPEHHLRTLDDDPRPERSKKRRRSEFQTLPTTLAPRRHAWYPPLRRAAEFSAALALALFALPAILLAALVVKLTSRGPAFYTQTRVGKNGRLFTIYKLRTMIHNCESLTGPRWSIPGDPRITRVGQFLRDTHLDELPQLLNVLRGDMSLIGPRPERPEFLPGLQRALPAYRERLAVRPGVTGLAQVQLAADTDLESVRQKLVYDLYYVERLSPWLDFRILVSTLFYALGDRGKLVRKLRLAPTGLPVERAMQQVVPTTPLPRQRSAA